MMYGAEPTAFLSWAREQGAEHLADGLGMLVGQAAEAFQLWRGVRPQTAPVIEALRAELGGSP
jgi:shikimate dehydrogenase